MWDCKVQPRRYSVLPHLENMFPNNYTIFLPFVRAVIRDDEGRRAAVAEPFHRRGVYFKSMWDCKVQPRRYSVLPHLENIFPNNYTIFLPFARAVIRDDEGRRAAFAKHSAPRHSSSLIPPRTNGR